MLACCCMMCQPFKKWYQHVELSLQTSMLWRGRTLLNPVMVHEIGTTRQSEAILPATDHLQMPEQVHSSSDEVLACRQAVSRVTDV